MTQTEFLPELQSFKWAGRKVNIIFDSDIADKPRVQEAETRLANELRRGGVIFKVRLPDGEGGEKVGLDDYLLTHSFDDLCKLISETRQADGSYALPKSIDTLMRADYPPTQWVWDGLVLQGEVNLLYGNGGVGKSLLALYAAMAVASGEAFCGLKTMQMPMLGLFAEDGEAEVQRRIRAISAERQTDAGKLPIALWCQPHEDTMLAAIDDTGIIKGLVVVCPLIVVQP